MFELIEKYILRTREERRSHLDLESKCVEIGGNSKEFRGLLAYSLGTTLPKGRHIQMCHACNNGGCSNVKHLYWGTAKDNHIDRVERGTFTSFEDRVKTKYSEEEIKLQRIEAGRKGGSSTRVKYEISPHGEDFLMLQKRVLEIAETLEWKHGWKARAAEELGISHTHVRRLCSV